MGPALFLLTCKGKREIKVRSGRAGSSINAHGLLEGPGRRIFMLEILDMDDVRFWSITIPSITSNGSLAGLAPEGSMPACHVDGRLYERRFRRPLGLDVGKRST